MHAKLRQCLPIRRSHPYTPLFCSTLAVLIDLLDGRETVPPEIEITAGQLVAVRRPHPRPTTGSDAAPAEGGERRDGSLRNPWQVHRVAAQASTFLAANRLTGRSFRLAVDTLAEAEDQVALLNRTFLELRA